MVRVRPGKRDHGVSAPIPKPVIARDDAAAIDVAGKRAFNKELVGGENELPEPAGFILSGRRVMEAYCFCQDWKSANS